MVDFLEIFQKMHSAVLNLNCVPCSNRDRDSSTHQRDNITEKKVGEKPFLLPCFAFPLLFCLSFGTRLADASYYRILLQRKLPIRAQYLVDGYPTDIACVKVLCLMHHIFYL